MFQLFEPIDDNVDLRSRREVFLYHKKPSILCHGVRILLGQSSEKVALEQEFWLGRLELFTVMVMLAPSFSIVGPQ